MNNNLGVQMLCGTHCT